MSGGLNIETEVLREAGTSLRVVATEFEHANARSDDAADATGHGGLADRVREFAHNWSRGLDDTLAATGEVTAHANRASEAIGLGQASVATGGAVDGFQLSGLLGGGDPPPSESLNLPKEP